MNAEAKPGEEISWICLEKEHCEIYKLKSSHTETTSVNKLLQLPRIQVAQPSPPGSYRLRVCLEKGFAALVALRPLDLKGGYKKA